MIKELLSVQFILKYFLLAAGTQDLGYEGLNGKWGRVHMAFVHSNSRSLFVKMQINYFKRELFSVNYFHSLFTSLTQLKFYTKCIT